MTPEQEMICREECERIQREREHGNPKTAAAMVEGMRLVLEVERTKSVTRQAEALERMAKSAEATAMAMTAMMATSADLASAINAMTATLQTIAFIPEIDPDQADLFEGGACACGKDHDAVG